MYCFVSLRCCGDLFLCCLYRFIIIKVSQTLQWQASGHFLDLRRTGPWLVSLETAVLSQLSPAKMASVKTVVSHLASRGSDSSLLLGLLTSIRAVAFGRSKNKRSLMLPICLLGVSSWHWWPLYAGKCDFMLLNSIMSSCNGTVCWITAISYHLIPAIEWHQPKGCLVLVIPWLNTHNCREKNTKHDWLSALDELEFCSEDF